MREQARCLLFSMGGTTTIYYVRVDMVDMNRMIVYNHTKGIRNVILIRGIHHAGYKHIPESPRHNE